MPNTGHVHAELDVIHFFGASADGGLAMIHIDSGALLVVEHAGIVEGRGFDLLEGEQVKALGIGIQCLQLGLGIGGGGRHCEEGLTVSAFLVWFSSEILGFSDSRVDGLSDVC